MLKNTVYIHIHTHEIQMSLPKQPLPGISIYICPNTNILKLLGSLC